MILNAEMALVNNDLKCLQVIFKTQYKDLEKKSLSAIPRFDRNNLIVDFKPLQTKANEPQQQKVRMNRKEKKTKTKTTDYPEINKSGSTLSP